MIKPVLEYLPVKEEDVFFAAHFNYAGYPASYHFHPEFEIVLITEGSGKRMAGKEMSDFEVDDLTLIGPFLPHLYRNAEEYYGHGSGKNAGSLVIHFLENTIGNEFLSSPAARKVREMLGNSVHGLDFTGKEKYEIIEKLHDIPYKKGLKKLISLVEVLEMMSECTKLSITKADKPLKTVPGPNKLEGIFDYLFQHFREPITLDHLADISNLTRTSFCRYFKSRTRRTCNEVLTELRLNYARRQLIETEKSVLEICFDSGFNNISNFNRFFKEKYNISPLQYRKGHILFFHHN